MDVFTEMFESLNGIPERHAIMVHTPIVVSLLTIPAMLALLISKGKSAALRGVALATFGLLLGSTILAVQSGEAARSVMGLVPDSANERVDKHESMAEAIWIFALVGMVAVAVTWVKNKRARIGGAVTGTLVAIATGMWVGATAHHGGTLVYTYGIGTPHPVEPPPPPPVIVESDSSDETRAVEEVEAEEVAPAGDARLALFVDEIYPIFESRCLGCHAGSGGAAGLDMTTMDAMLKGGDNGPALIPGDAEESLIAKLIRDEGPLERMPLIGDPLTPEQIALIEQWIREGAVWSAS